MRSRMAVDSMVSKMDHTPLLMGSDVKRSASKSCPERALRRGRVPESGARPGPAPERTRVRAGDGSRGRTRLLGRARHRDRQDEAGQKDGRSQTALGAGRRADSCVPLGYESPDCTRTAGAAWSGSSARMCPITLRDQPLRRRPPPRSLDDGAEHVQPHLREANEDGRVVRVVVGEVERGGYSSIRSTRSSNEQRMARAPSSRRRAEQNLPATAHRRRAVDTCLPRPRAARARGPGTCRGRWSVGPASSACRAGGFSSRRVTARLPALRPTRCAVSRSGTIPRTPAGRAGEALRRDRRPAANSRL